MGEETPQRERPRRWGLVHAAGVLAVKLGADVAIGAVLWAGPGHDASAVIICLLSAVSWLPVLALLALAARATSDAPLVPWRGPGGHKTALVVAVGVAVTGVSLVLSILAGDTSTPLEDAIRSPLDLWAVVVFALVVAPVVEEIFFRGYLYTALENTLGGWLSVLLVGLLFGLFHGLQYAGVPAALAAVTLMGLGTTWVRRYTGGVLPCILLHVAYNAVGITVLLLTTEV